MVNQDKTSAQLERSTTPPQERSQGTHHYKRHKYKSAAQDNERGAHIPHLGKCPTPHSYS